MTEGLPSHHQQNHYAQIVSLLRAINVQSSVFFNGAIYGVQVMPGGTRAVVWSNYDNWAFTVVRPDGTQWVHNSQVRADAPPEAAAQVIAFTDYDEANHVEEAP